MSEFDITKHEWSDRYAKVHCIRATTRYIFLDSEDNSVEVSKADAIAIARHFKLTEGDLK